MRKYYTLLSAILILFSAGCGPGLLQRSEKKILGSWQIAEVTSAGTGPWETFDFRYGTLTFLNGDHLEYVSKMRQFYKGAWQIEMETFDEQKVCVLKMVAINTQRPDTLSEYYTDVHFTGTDRFVANIFTSNRTYCFEFKK